jgi:diketogulonate reductase-like aldo/keto reductase
VKTGFRAIDTACQPKHYHEPGVGDALQQLYDEDIIKREDIFLQTKFTPVRGQDPNNIPYDESKPLPEQVKESFQVSCKNLKTDYLDSLVLHSPYAKFEDTLSVWRSFEEIYARGGTLALGLSNTYDLNTLQRLHDAASIKPRFLQNRFYRESNYDVDIRKYCAEVGIQYQSFWTLTANPHVTRSAMVQSIAKKYQKTPAQIFFRFVRSLGIVILTGTTSIQHMQEDLMILDETFTLTEEEINQIASVLQ